MKFVALIAALLVCSLSVRADTPPISDGPTADDAIKAYHEGHLPDLIKALETHLRTGLALKKLDEPAIVRLASLRAFARRMGSVKPASPEEGETLDWLVQHPVLGPMLFTALSDRDNPVRVLSILTTLRKTFGKTIEQFPELTVATCVVWDSPAVEGQTTQQSTQAACEVFEHLTKNRRTLRFDPQLQPWQVLVYLVDSRITPEERLWAMTQYRLPPEPGRAYFDIRYDMTGFISGQWRGGNKQPYTLWNIQRLGGVCKDQAHFTVEVCRAYGIPATVCTAQSGTGEGFHAWVGLLAMNQKTPVFDFTTARYAEHGFWSGTVIDPQTGAKLTDGEAAMVAEWCAVNSNRRLLSLSLSESLDLLDTAAQRIALCKLSIESAPGNQQAWTALVNECIKPEAPPETIAEVAAVVQRFAIGRYDDFAFKVFVTLIKSRRPDDQLATLDRAAKLFPNRPDLLAQISLLKGDLFRDNARPVDAMRLYGQLLGLAHRFGPLMLDTMDRVETMLRSAGKMRELLDRYRIVWQNMLVPEASGYAWTTPWYLMGERLARLLDETNNKTDADTVRQILRKRDLSHRDEAKTK